jgi:hypothetical protein
MTGCCTTTEKASDLINKKAAWLLWYIPAAAVLFGFFWAQARAWLWIPAFLVMGTGCLANATRCGRLHCYVLGPMYILAALYIALSLFGVIRLNPGIFLLIVLGASCIAVCLEIPFGRYKAKERL